MVVRRGLDVKLGKYGPFVRHVHIGQINNGNKYNLSIHLASIFLTFSVTRAMVSSVFKGKEANDDGLLTSCNGELDTF